MLATILGLGFWIPGYSQVVSINAVGYINWTFRQGDQLFGNQLLADRNNLNALLPNNVPAGTTISVWDSQSRSYLAPSVYSPASGWSIDYVLMPGIGALMHAPADFVSTFVGEIVGFDFFSNSVIPPTPPGDGMFLLACRVPLTGANFYNVIGRAPQEGDSVTRWDNLTGTYFSTAFRGGDWDNGEPAFKLMEGAFFNLGPASVPEPSIFALSLTGLLALSMYGWRVLRG